MGVCQSQNRPKHVEEYGLPRESVPLLIVVLPMRVVVPFQRLPFAAVPLWYVVPPYVSLVWLHDDPFMLRPCTSVVLPYRCTLYVLPLSS